MTTTLPEESSNPLSDQAAQSADQAIKSTQRLANTALDSLSGTVQTLRNQAAPLLNRAGEQASALAQRSVDAVRDSSQQLREQAQRVSDGTANYVKEEPVKALLIAAATGALLMGVISLLSRSSQRG